jgi:hypothetical protein
MRTVPDLALHIGGWPGIAVQPCGPDRSFDWVGIDNGFFGFVGTSASSPDIAGLMALKIQFLGSPLGSENSKSMRWQQRKQPAGRPSSVRTFRAITVRS